MYVHLIGSRFRTISYYKRIDYLPGFIESHGYLMGLGWKEKYLDLSKAGTYDELIRMVADTFRKAKWLTQDKSRREK
ncbi:MAG: hypothetical protein AMS17_16345 [Spirochaetes bacterium DG_61]|nr:MAG: hypothetical protein AMS17_16345 [Spirochaetes bacterium DG_61]